MGVSHGRRGIAAVVHVHMPAPTVASAAVSLTVVSLAVAVDSRAASAVPSLDWGPYGPCIAPEPKIVHTPSREDLLTRRSPYQRVLSSAWSRERNAGVSPIPWSWAAPG